MAITDIRAEVVALGDATHATKRNKGRPLATQCGRDVPADNAHRPFQGRPTCPECKDALLAHSRRFIEGWEAWARSAAGRAAARKSEEGR